MILPFAFSAKMRKVRHRLILGLAVTDFLEAFAVSLQIAMSNTSTNSPIKVLIPTARAIQGRTLGSSTPGCRITGIVYYVCVVGNGLWAVS